MVKAPRRLFDAVVWRQFSDVHTDLWTYFEQTTERLIREAIHTDTTDAEVRSGCRAAPSTALLHFVWKWGSRTGNTRLITLRNCWQVS